MSQESYFLELPGDPETHKLEEKKPYRFPLRDSHIDERAVARSWKGHGVSHLVFKTTQYPSCNKGLNGSFVSFNKEEDINTENAFTNQLLDLRKE